MANKYPVVEIEWADACSPSNEMEQCSIDQAIAMDVPLVQLDYGILLGRNVADDAYILASNAQKDSDQIRRRMLIPICNIRRITKLKAVKELKI